MNVDFVLENTHDDLVGLEMACPPQVGNKISLFPKGSEKQETYVVTGVEFVQLEHDRTYWNTPYGRIEAVGAICEVVPFEGVARIRARGGVAPNL